jgi:hypothetical protein
MVIQMQGGRVVKEKEVEPPCAASSKILAQFNNQKCYQPPIIFLAAGLMLAHCCGKNRMRLQTLHRTALPSISTISFRNGTAPGFGRQA